LCAKQRVLGTPGLLHDSLGEVQEAAFLPSGVRPIGEEDEDTAQRHRFLRISGRVFLPSALEELRGLLQILRDRLGGGLDALAEDGASKGHQRPDRIIPLAQALRSAVEVVVRGSR
jgi:hypothetical protein